MAEEGYGEETQKRDILGLVFMIDLILLRTPFMTQYVEFTQDIRRIHSSLFTNKTPLAMNIASELVTELAHNPEWADKYGRANISKHIHRFISEWTTDIDYQLALCRAFVAGSSRQGLNSKQPILPGEVMETLINIKSMTEDADTSSLLNNPMYQFAIAAEQQLNE